MEGYWNAAGLTAEAISGGWFYSGDLASQDAEGFLYLRDRKKDLIITGGFNVYPNEVEEVIYTHAAVSECAVVGLPDPDWGEAVTAFVIPKRGATVDVADILGHCSRALAGFKKPKRVVLVDEIPRNPSGKVLRRVLRGRYAGV
jgi:acyl-CoA synthetase (AMP-forming)/AMP-acid ligase II